MHILFTGGGTAGHVIPALAVAAACIDRGDRVTFVGSKSGLEEELVRPHEIAFKGIHAGKLRRYFSLRNVTDIFKVIAGFIESLWILARDRPSVVLSKGGFVSLPVVYAAWVLRVPIVLHECDYSPGLANRLSVLVAQTMCTAFEDTPLAAGPRSSRQFRQVCTGMPLRRALLNGNAQKGRTALGLQDDDRLLVITGGSLGAQLLNQVVVEALDELCERYVVLHVCGKGKMELAPRDGYMPKEFVGDGWGDILAAADFVISRAGANTLFELMALGKKCLFVPLSRRVSRGDQIENALYAERLGFASVLQEEDLTVASLMLKLAELTQTKEQQVSRESSSVIMNATERLVAEIDWAAERR